MLIHNYDSNLQKSSVEQICENEMESFILQFGSMISMMSGKNASVVHVFNQLLQHPYLRDILCENLECDWFEVVDYFAHRYPILSKSKRIQQEELEYD